MEDKPFRVIVCRLDELEDQLNDAAANHGYSTISQLHILEAEEPADDRVLAILINMAASMQETMDGMLKQLQDVFERKTERGGYGGFESESGGPGF